MRTVKALACAVTLAAGLATSMAQSNVYSLNVVGYYNITVSAGQIVAMANQLNTTNNTLGGIIASAPDYTQVYFYNGGGYDILQYVGPDNFGNGWAGGPGNIGPAYPVAVGQGFLYQDPGAPSTGVTLTFVGEVKQGTMSQTLQTTGSGVTLAASQVPLQATLGALAIPAEDYDYVYFYSGGWGNPSQYVGPDNFGNGWTGGTGDGNGPTVNVGQSFAYIKAPGNVSSTWTQNFTVQ